MGLFNKLKNMVTGGGAKVTLEVLDPQLRSPFSVKIKVVVDEADLEISGVYLKVAGLEKVKIKNVKVGTTSEGQPQHRDIEDTAYTFQEKLEVAGAQNLVARGGYDWEATVTLPPDAKKTYQGINASHVWMIQAGLAVSGNDPDSGWIVIDPS